MAAVDTWAIEVAVLDDDTEFRGYVADLLSDEGHYKVHTFAHSDDLFAACAIRSPDIVLLDMKMGPVRGESVLEDLLTRWPKLCVIIVTGYPSLEDMRATFKKRAFDYISKPFSLAQLRETLKAATASHGLGRSDLDRMRESFGHRVRVLRIEQNWSLKDLAEAAEISQSQISSIERGAHLPSLDSMFKICAAFKLRPSRVLSSIGF